MGIHGILLIFTCFNSTCWHVWCAGSVAPFPTLIPSGCHQSWFDCGGLGHVVTRGSTWPSYHVGLDQNLWNIIVWEDELMNTPINSMNRRGLMAFDPWPWRWTFSGEYCIIDRNADLQIATWDSPRRMETWLANAVSEKVTERTHWPLSHTNVFTSLALSGWCKFVRLQQALKRLFYNIVIYSSKTAMLRSTIAY